VTPIIDKKLLYNSQLKHVGVKNVAISVQIIEMKLTKTHIKPTKIPPQVVFWVGIFFMLIRNRLSVLMTIHIRIHILSLALHLLPKQKNFGILFAEVTVYIVYLSHQRHGHPIIKYLGK